VRDGFSGPIFMTAGTAELAEVVLYDSAKIQTEDAEFAAKKGYSKHAKPLPLYTERDVTKAISQFRVVDFRAPISVTADTSVTFYPAGHILGAAFVSVEMADKKVLFSGDLGRPQHPLLRSPDAVPNLQFDAIVSESTYGDRTHEGPDAIVEFTAAINRTLKRGGSVLIPAFAVDRTEVVLMELRRLMDEQQIPRVPIWVDSPMALTALRHYREAIVQGSDEIRADIIAGYSTTDPFDGGTLREARSVEDSKQLNDPLTPSIIISASGMATGGRVVHHLAGMLPDPKNTVLMVGYQAVGTRGRALVDGATALKMYGQYIPVKAEIVEAGSFSVHADSGELIAWLKSAEFPPRAMYIVHGEDESAQAFAKKVETELQWMAVVPRDGEQVVL
jgi:metallo-beta-lactamase family protein